MQWPRQWFESTIEKVLSLSSVVVMKVKGTTTNAKKSKHGLRAKHIEAFPESQFQSSAGLRIVATRILHKFRSIATKTPKKPAHRLIDSNMLSDDGKTNYPMILSSRPLFIAVPSL